MPIIADKYANVFLIYGKRWNSSIDGELGSASTKRPNLSRGKAHPLEQQGAAVALDRIDIHESWLSRCVEHWSISCIQFRRHPARERVTPSEVDWRGIIQRCGARTYTEAQCMGIMRYRCVVLE